MVRRLTAALLALVVTVMADAATPRKNTRQAAPQAKRTMTNIKKEREATAKAIKLTAEQIESNKRQTARTLNELNLLNADIKSHTQSIAVLTVQLDSIDHELRAVNDSIAYLDGHIKQLKESYAASVKRLAQSQRSDMSKLAFIFASESFSQAYRRMRYLGEFSKWRTRKNEELQTVQRDLDAKRRQLATLQQEKGAAVDKLGSECRQLETKQQQSATLISRLKKEGASLKAVLREKEQQARALDAELDRLIAEEQRRQEAAAKAAAAKKEPEGAGKTTAKEAEKAAPAPKDTKSSAEGTLMADAAVRKLSGSFESNRGRLLFPVTGRYKIVRPFGRHRHPDLPNVEIDNSGIDIETAPGANARAVFDGKVSAIFQQPGFNNILMVRHGSYLSIYANLGNILVKNGDTVKAGQALGRIYADPDDGNRSVLHFELRKEKEKLNPTAWVK